MIRLDIKHTSCGVSESEILSLASAADSANSLLHNGEGAGNDFLGWVNLPSSITAEQIEAIHNTCRVLFQSDLSYLTGCDKAESDIAETPERNKLIEFIRNSKRGVIKQYQSRR